MTQPKQDYELYEDTLKDKETPKGFVYRPTLILDIFVNNNEKYCSIRLEDNGEGFTELNRKEEVAI